MDLIKKIENYRKIFFPKIYIELEKYKNTFSKYKKEKNELLDLLKKFIIKGKGIRGSLVYLTNEIFELKINQKNVFYLASFFEIIHSSLLIHDDIMDNDKLRRGEKTIHFYFNEKFKKIKNNDYLGKNFAINLGDIGFFIGFSLFNKIKIENKIKERLWDILCKEYIKVALAQIDDVYYSQTKAEPKIEDIKKIYLYKTARYTFVLPIISTLVLKNNPLSENKELISILEKLGILFQITDDLIGFLSNETGKDIGSDIRENKKTIIRFYLMKELSNTSSSLKKLFGKDKLKKDEIEKIRKFYFQSKTKKIIDNLIIQLKKEILLKLENNRFPKKINQLITNFIDYLIERKK